MIIAPPHMDITLTFLTFDLENDPLLVGEGDCKYDWLDVWDGLPQGEGITHTHTHTVNSHSGATELILPPPEICKPVFNFLSSLCSL